jgi:hypothetical protein
MFGHVTRADLYKLVSKPVLARWMATYKVVFGVQRAIGMSARGRLICHSASSPRARRKAFWHIVVVCAARLWDLNIGRSKSFGGAGGHRRSHFGGLSIDYCPAVEKERIYSMMIVLKECNKDSTVIVETRLFKGWSGVAKTKDRRQRIERPKPTQIKQRLFQHWIEGPRRLIQNATFDEATLSETQDAIAPRGKLPHVSPKSRVGTQKCMQGPPRRLVNGFGHSAPELGIEVWPIEVETMRHGDE